MSEVRTTEWKCKECGWLFYRAKHSGGGKFYHTADELIEEWHPPVPRLVRLSPGRRAQVFCIHCKKVTAFHDEDMDGTERGYIFADACPPDEDSLRVAELGIPSAPLAAYSPQTPGLGPPAEAFKSNIERIDGLNAAIVLGIGLTKRSGMLRGGQSDAISGDKHKDEATPPKVIDLYLEQIRLYESLSPELRETALNWGKTQLRVWLPIHREIRLGVEAIFSLQIVSLWTAIETLLGDLWEEAINARPSGLGDLKGKPGTRISRLAMSDSANPKVGKSTTDDEHSDDNKGRSILLSELRRVSRGSYNVSNLVGTLLRAEFNFSRLSSIREAYSLAFFEHSNGVDKALSDKAFDALNVARNVLVHKAGRADQEYIGRTKSISTLPQLALGEQLVLNGTTTTNLNVPAIEAANRLIRAVDQWIISHS